MSRLQEEVELEKCVRRLRETFHGKIPIDKATTLMRSYMNNYQLVAKFIVLMTNEASGAGLDLESDERWSLKNDPVVKNVVQKLQNEEREKEKRKDAPAGASSDPKTSKQPKANKQPQEDKDIQPKANKHPQEDKDIQELAEDLQCLPLTEKNKRMFDRAQQNQIPSEERQFACRLCDRSWWRRVPVRKMVSRCRTCKQKYDALPLDKMWGIADFTCPNCYKSFKGFGRMDVGSPCYNCHHQSFRSIVMPTRILPPRKHLINFGQRRRQAHSCLAADCYNRQEPHIPGTECVHPMSRRRNGKPRVVNPSEPHVSSGSTVNTCLSQGSLLETLYDIILEDIVEEEQSDSDSERSTSS